jgi:hypothetical protein
MPNENDANDFSQLEELDVIEARELNVGNAFHAFRFRATSEKVDTQTEALLEEAAKAMGVKLDEFQQLAQQTAVEPNAYGNFARGVLAALKTRK